MESSQEQVDYQEVSLTLEPVDQTFILTNSLPTTRNEQLDELKMPETPKNSPLVASLVLEGKEGILLGLKRKRDYDLTEDSKEEDLDESVEEDSKESVEEDSKESVEEDSKESVEDVDVKESEEEEEDKEEEEEEEEEDKEEEEEEEEEDKEEEDEEEYESDESLSDDEETYNRRNPPVPAPLINILYIFFFVQLFQLYFLTVDSLSSSHVSNCVCSPFFLTSSPLYPGVIQMYPAFPWTP